MALTAKQRRFVDEYLVDLNATQAAIRAGYSERTAGSVGHDLLKKPEIAAAIQEAMRARGERTEVTADRVLQEAARLALFDPRRLFNADGSPKGILELDDDSAAAIAGLEVLEQFEGSGKDRVFVGYLKKYKLADKNSALEKLFKHHGLYEKDNRQKTDPIAEFLASMSRSALPVVKDDGQ